MIAQPVKFFEIANRFLHTARVHVSWTKLYDACLVLIELIHLPGCAFSRKILLKFLLMQVHHILTVSHFFLNIRVSSAV